MLAHVSRSETDSQNAYLKLEEQLRAFASRMDATERHQSENSRAMSKAAAAINVATREQAQAYDQLGGSVRNLTERMERVERQNANDPVKDAVRGLHHGLTRLADQMSQTAETSATQISSLADNLEALAAKVGQAKDDTGLSLRAIEARSAAIEQRLLGLENSLESQTQAKDHAELTLHAIDARNAAIEQRLLGVENSLESQTQSRDHADLTLRAIEQRLLGVENSLESQSAEMAKVAQNAVAIARLEDGIAGLEAHAADSSLERRLNSVERALADVVGRMEAPDRQDAIFEERLKSLANRVEASEKSQREAAGELRQAIAKLAQRPQEPPQPKRFEPAPFPFHAPFEPIEPVQLKPVDPAPPFPVHAPVEPTPAFPVHAAVEPPPPVPDFGALPANAPSFAEAPSFADAPSFAETAESALPPFPAFEPSAPEPAPFPPAANLNPDHLAAAQASDTFLAAARRSAQAAAAQAEAERMNRGFGGFAWGSQSKDAAAGGSKRYGLIGLVLLVVVLIAVAGILFSERQPSQTAQPKSLSHEFSERAAPAMLKPTAPAVDALSQPVPGGANPAPAEVQAAPPPVVDTQTAPSSPVLPRTKAQRLAAARLHRLAVPKAANVAVATPPPAPLVKRLAPQAAPAAASNQPATPAATQPAAAAPVAALDRVTQLANAGNPRAETVVGLRYLDGNGVPANDAEGAKWLGRAAEHGQPVAEYRLGTLYERGRGVPADVAKALHWYQSAAQAGNRKAMHNLAVAYAQGSGVPKDFAEAARWFSKAAGLGLADSQFNLAVLYERGLGVPQSLLDAYKWYAIAAAQGDAESKSRIEAIGTQLSPDDRAAAQRSAEQFKPAPMDAAANVAPQVSDVAG